MPQDWEQYLQLYDDTMHSYFDYPLDHEIIEGGNSYHNSALSDSTPEYQYTAIEEGFPIDNGIPYEILSSLYIPEEDDVI